ncbi:glycosyltransferase [Paenibacillus tarimensis]|uniref:glycosyltransferase n=1 Tax=Paenibacillus tarimensis TaxID=416012 RepID=UPI001F35508F|nr:nucleotide disphospho-sugar-binding domain-containing protein [Paenibacillus tarimensis]MCF2945190.1 hypothetical protein [Paenibacillus tarimensis]
MRSGHTGCRIAVVSQKLLGHAIPALGIGQALAERGHDVYYLGHSSLRPLVEGSLVKLAEIEWGVIPTDFIFETMEEITCVLRQIGAELLITDSAMAAPAYCAELLGIPWVSFQTSIPLPDRLIPGNPSIVKRARSRYEGQLNHVRTKAGLPALADERRTRGDLAGISPHLHLAMVYPQMIEHWEELPANTEVIGACAYAPDIEPLASPDDSRPSVLICSSSLMRVDYRAIMQNYIHTSLTALEAAPVNLLLSEQNGLRLRKPFPPNLHFYSEYPVHDRLLPFSSAAITHGGCNTIQKAMRFGVPMVIIPLGDEQPLLAERCVKLGIAIMISSDDISEDSMRQAVAVLLEDQSPYTLAASKLADDLKAGCPNIRGAELVERVLRH